MLRGEITALFLVGGLSCSGNWAETSTSAPSEPGKTPTEEGAPSQPVPIENRDDSGKNQPVPENPLTLFDLAGSKARGDKYYYDVQAATAALQGIANRESAKLYVLVPSDSEYEDFHYAVGQNYDQYWLDKLGKWGLVKQTVVRSSFRELLEIEQLNQTVKGAVLWHESTPATLNAAFTLAGVENLIPIRKTEEAGSLYSELILSGKLKVIKDLSFLQSKTSVYQWLIKEYVTTQKINCSLLGYTVDGYAFKKPYGPDLGLSPLGQPLSRHVYNNQLLSRDYLVSQKSLMFDLQPYKDRAPIDDLSQPKGADFMVLETILSNCKSQLPPASLGTVVGFPNWLWKYSETSGGIPGWEAEWNFARVISKHYFLKDADAVHPAGMSNASVFQHFQLQTSAPNNPPANPPAYEANRTYVHIYMGDFDSAAWVWFHARFLWDDPARGQIPLSWGFNPNLSERVPVAFRYYFETATGNDYFVGGNSGAGYINPGYLDASGLSRWENHCSSWYKKLGYSLTGWSLNGFAGAFSKNVMDAFSRCSPGGVITHDGHFDGNTISTVNGTPFVQELFHKETKQALTFSLRNQESPEALADFFLAHTPSTRMIALRNVLMEPTRVVQLARALEARGAKVVDPYTFFEFAAKRAQAKY